MTLFEFKEYFEEKGWNQFKYLSSEQTGNNSRVFIENAYDEIRFCFNPNLVSFYQRGRRSREDVIMKKIPSWMFVTSIKCVECCEDGALNEVRFICDDGSECLIYAL